MLVLPASVIEGVTSAKKLDVIEVPVGKGMFTLELFENATDPERENV